MSQHASNNCKSKSNYASVFEVGLRGASPAVSESHAATADDACASPYSIPSLSESEFNPILIEPADESRELELEVVIEAAESNFSTAHVTGRSRERDRDHDMFMSAKTTSNWQSTMQQSRSMQRIQVQSNQSMQQRDDDLHHRKSTMTSMSTYAQLVYVASSSTLSMDEIARMSVNTVQLKPVPTACALARAAQAAALVSSDQLQANIDPHRKAVTTVRLCCAVACAVRRCGCVYR